LYIDGSGDWLIHGGDSKNVYYATLIAQLVPIFSLSKLKKAEEPPAKRLTYGSVQLYIQQQHQYASPLFMVVWMQL
jgi:hypothetical protein